MDVKQALTIYAVLLGAIHASYLSQGYLGTAEIAFGALTVMALMISAIFLWLWAMRMSPLSLGMAFSWAGAAMVMGWWWLFTLLGAPVSMERSEMLLGLVGLMLTGAVLHFEVLETSLGHRRGSFLLPVAGAFAVSVLLLILVR